MAPRVSIVIVTWNGLHHLQRFLPSVLATDYPNFEVLVADNASTDGTVAWLTTTCPKVKVIRHPDNWLFARGNNAAINQTSSEFVCLLNNDVEVPPDWLSPLVGALVSTPKVAAVQPKLMQVENRSSFEYAGASGGFIDQIGYPFARGRLFSTVEEDKGQYDDSRDIVWASGACMLIRRDAFDDVGGLDERFEMHMEEIDMCWRLWRKGWHVQVEPNSEAYHLGGGTLSEGSPRKTYLNFRNSLLMLYKNTPKPQWPTVRRLRSRMDRLAFAKTLLSGQMKEAQAIQRARRDALALFEHYQDDRPYVDETNVMPTYRGVIAADYFFRGRKRFSDLPVSNWD